ARRHAHAVGIHPRRWVPTVVSGYLSSSFSGTTEVGCPLAGRGIQPRLRRKVSGNMNGLAWDQILLVIGLVLTGIVLIVARRPIFDLVMWDLEDWLPGHNPYSRLRPSPLFFGALGVLLIAAGILAAVSLAVPGFTLFV
ncbi:MAG: hypothetical protein ACSHW9_02695, partial [Salinibacterium amurskyense]